MVTDNNDPRSRNRSLIAVAAVATVGLVLMMSTLVTWIVPEEERDKLGVTDAPTPVTSQLVETRTRLSPEEFLAALHDCYEDRGLQVVRRADGSYQVGAGPGGPAAFEALRESCAAGLGATRRGIPADPP